jgi:hypothetical protein
MSNRTIMGLVILLGLALWIGLVVLMNQRPPDSAHQVLFLLVWGAAMWCTMVPISYGLNVRFASSLGESGNLSRAVRQGLLGGVLAVVLMALRFMRVLNLFTAAMLILVAMLLETLLALRRA